METEEKKSFIWDRLITVTETQICSLQGLQYLDVDITWWPDNKDLQHNESSGSSLGMGNLSTSIDAKFPDTDIAIPACH